jgi:hypothetical protein
MQERRPTGEVSCAGRSEWVMVLAATAGDELAVGDDMGGGRGNVHLVDTHDWVNRASHRRKLNS